MPGPDLESDVQAVRELQIELDKRGTVVPKSLMPLENEEHTMFRFLKARKMNVEAAADMLQNTVRWRTEAKIDECLETFLPDDKDNKLRKFLPSGFVGLDKAGSPVWMEHAAAIDVPGMEAAGISLEDFVYYHCRAMEYMVNCKYTQAAEKSGHPVESHCVILDLAGLRMNMLNQNTIKVFKSISGIYQDHYPELMSRMFLVNIPLMFAAVWRVLQMFVDDRVKAKIRFLRKADFHILHEFVDRDQLPESLGGKSKEKLLSDKQGYVPASLLAVNAEVQRRIDAKQAATQVSTQPAIEHQESQRIPTPTPAEPPLSKDSYYSTLDTSDLPTEMHTSSSTDDLESQSSGPILVSELPAHRQPIGMTDAELSKLAALKSEAQQAQQPAGAQQPGAMGAEKGPVNILAKADYTQKAAAAPGQGKQRRKSKREKAKGLLSSFTSSRKHNGRQEEDMDQALQMLAELRRTESTPNVEAEALKRNKGGGGPWMSFTRQRRPPKPRPAKRGGASPRRGSPLATVVSGDVHNVALAANAVKANVTARTSPSDTAERPHSKKWNPFCMRAPMVHGDDDSPGNIEVIDSRLPGTGLSQAAGTPTSAPASATLTQRLSKKLSAIPAYLQTADDPEALRLASPEPSGSSMSGSALSAALLKGTVTGRYASAPDLQALLVQGNTQAAGRGLVPGPSPAGTLSPQVPPRSPAARGVARSLSYGQSHAGQKPFGAGAFSDKPNLGTAGPAAVVSTGSQHVLQMVQENEKQTAVRRQLQRNTRLFMRNWALLLVLGVSLVNVVVCLKPIIWS